MAYINDSLKLDLLWKKLQFGVSQTHVSKSPYEELTKSSEQLRASELWQQDNLIPVPAAATGGIVELVDIRCRVEPSVTDSTTWVAVRVYANGITSENRLRDFISPKFDGSYEIRVYSDVAKQNRIYNSASETNWIFDYSSGILWFPNVATKPTEVYVVGYRYIGPKGLNPTFDGDVIDVLTDLTDGSFAGGYIPGWVENETKISDAIDALNRALLDFMPKAPVTLSELYLEMPGAVSVINDSNVVLSSGAKDNTGSLGFKPKPGEQVSRVAGINLETNYVGPFGNGNSGSLSAEVNNISVGSINLGPGDDSGIYSNSPVGKLDLNQDISTEGENTSFYETLTARVVGLDLPMGLNGINLKHTETGTTNTLWVVRDSLNTKPVVNWVTVGETPNVQLTYSSGVPHYMRGSQLVLGSSASDLATDMYLDTKNIEFQSLPKQAGPNVWAYPGAYGLPQILVKGTGYSANNVVFTIADYAGSVGHGTAVFKATARNANGKAEFTGDKKVNYMRGGTPIGISPVEEAGVPVKDLGTYETGFKLYAERILLDASDFPAANLVEGETLPTWESEEIPELWEAVVVGGALQHSQENYSQYLPVGPNYTSKTGVQYATFAVQRKNVSQLNIEIEGRYTGLWVKLPGLSDQPMVAQGWMDCFKNYEGWGVPGREVLGGCAVGRAAFGGSQTVTATFGYESSSNSVNNLILVRFKFVPGDSITGLRFSGVAR